MRPLGEVRVDDSAPIQPPIFDTIFENCDKNENRNRSRIAPVAPPEAQLNDATILPERRFIPSRIASRIDCSNRRGIVYSDLPYSLPDSNPARRGHE